MRVVFNDGDYSTRVKCAFVVILGILRTGIRIAGGLGLIGWI